MQIRPLEEAYKFGGFFSSYLNESDFSAKPSVLLLGQYSTGLLSPNMPFHFKLWLLGYESMNRPCMATLIFAARFVQHNPQLNVTSNVGAWYSMQYTTHAMTQTSC